MLKKLFLLVFSFLILTTPTLAYQGDWAITRFDSDINVQADGIVHIQETIVADFSETEKHGIYREIPIKYDTEEGKVRVDFSFKGATDEKGQAWTVKKTYEGNNVKLRFGDADITYSEPLTYIIDYEVRGVINFFEEYDELYWNSTGTDWPVEILKSRTTVHIPKGANQSELRYNCFTGAYSSEDMNCVAKQLNPTTFQYTSTTLLNPYEGISIGLALPKGLVEKPPVSLWAIFFIFLFFTPLITIFFVIRYWYVHGKDPAGKGTIMPYFKPPRDLSPTQVGALVDEKVHTKDISVGIINLAVRGHIKIHEEKGKGWFASTETTFLKTGKNPKNLDAFDKKLMKSLFGSKKSVKVKDLKNEFYIYMPELEKMVYDSLIDEKYFLKNPKKVRTLFLSLGAGIVFLSLYTTALIAIFPWLFLNLFTLGFGILSIALFMPKKTEKGVQALEEIKGFKMFVKTAEKNRLDVLQKFRDEEGDIDGIKTFEKILPYAIVLGLGKKWASMFQDIYNGTEPNWYSGNSLNTFNIIQLQDRLGSIQSVAASSMTSTPPSAASGGSSFGGGGFSGGFSGGGFGGGGGGSW